MVPRHSIRIELHQFLSCTRTLLHVRTPWIKPTDVEVEEEVVVAGSGRRSGHRVVETRTPTPDIRGGPRAANSAIVGRANGAPLEKKPIW